MKRREKPEIRPDVPIAYEANPSYLPELTVKLLVIEGAAQILAQVWHVPQWIAWQLPVAYLYWVLRSERALTLRIVRAWNKRLGPPRQDAEPVTSDDAERILRRFEDPDGEQD
jgi:hypothetical protein